ncbi:MAG: alanyl-tRNA editing protein [Clostridia bacterium]|nr:alanyl-tRNA editing protein [Clostridia bacterium]
MTIHLYDKDSSLLEFDATVLSCEAKGDQYIVVLDQTAFFPEGGGQGADQGTLGGVRVLDAHEVGGQVQHLTDGALPVGETVHGSVDAKRRLAMMQQHSGEHIFSGIVHQLFGYDNVGFHIGSEAVTMDFNGPLTEEDVLRVERMANEIIWKNIPVVTLLPSADELAQMEYRSKKALTGEVRIVTIEGADTCACCGTHVKYTGSIGQIKVLSCQKYKSGVRVSILCGTRALDEENMLLGQVKRASTALSCKQPEVADSVAKLLADRDNLRAQNDALGMRVFDMMAQSENGREIRVVVCDVLPAAQARKAAGKLAAGAKAALVLIPRAEGGYSFAMSSEQTDIRPATKALCEAFGGRGGGPKDMTQGVLGAAQESEIREKIAAIVG